MIHGVTLLFLACVAAEANDLSDSFEKWKEFKQKYGKSYATVAEELSRFNIFFDNKRNIDEHNKQFEAGLHSYKVAMNQFGDMTHQGFLSSFLDDKPPLPQNEFTHILDAPTNFSLPYEIDWRQKGYVTAVKNRGLCESCWAFAAVSKWWSAPRSNSSQTANACIVDRVLEGQWFKKTGKLIALSEQNLMDCSRDFGNLGCHGGFTINAFKYIMANGGIDTEASYPYEARVGTCRFERRAVGATVERYELVKPDDESGLQAAIATIGPITVSVDAKHGFQFYSSGVFYSNNCTTTELNHAVVAVGYRVSIDGQAQKYYIVKNSWGADWGESGYIRMARDKENNCGIATQAIYPVV